MTGGGSGDKLEITLCLSTPEFRASRKNEQNFKRDLDQINPRDWWGLGGAPPFCLVPGVELTLHVGVNPL